MLPIRYWNRITNIGDSINPHIFELVSQQKPYYAIDDTQEHVLGIGSIFFMATRNSHIWGSGVMDPKRDYDRVDVSKIHAVRGKLTESMLRERYGLSKSVALGDPGIFADEIPEIADTLRRNDIKRGTIVIPHYAMADDERIGKLARNLDAAVLSPRTSGLDFLTEIAAAEIVVSQSLHGLIFAEVFGKPSVWIAHSGDEVWTFKFRDWFTNTIDPPKEPLPLDASPARILERARLSGLAIDRNALRHAMPDLRVEGREAGVGFRECRERSPLLLFILSDKKQEEASKFSVTLYCEPGNEEMLRRILNAYGRQFDEPVCLFLIFEQDAGWRPDSERLHRYVDLLTEFPDAHYFGFLPARDDTMAEAPRRKSVRNEISFYDWNPKFNWRGAVLVRNSVNFSFAAPGYASFIEP
jgi:hypothetical protein